VTTFSNDWIQYLLAVCRWNANKKIRKVATSLCRSLSTLGQYQWVSEARGGKFGVEEDWSDKDAAAAGMRYLNAGNRSPSLGALASCATLSRMPLTSSGEAVEEDIVPREAPYAGAIG